MVYNDLKNLYQSRDRYGNIPQMHSKTPEDPQKDIELFVFGFFNQSFNSGKGKIETVFRNDIDLDFIPLASHRGNPYYTDTGTKYTYELDVQPMFCYFLKLCSYIKWGSP